MARVAAQSISAKEIVTVAATAVGFTAGLISGKSYAFVTAESGQMRYWVDGSTPTASEGHLLEVGANVELRGVNTVANFRAIRTGGSSGSLMCSYGV